jgi:hypothetical protein
VATCGARLLRLVVPEFRERATDTVTNSGLTFSFSNRGHVVTLKALVDKSIAAIELGIGLDSSDRHGQTTNRALREMQTDVRMMIYHWLPSSCRRESATALSTAAALVRGPSR